MHARSLAIGQNGRPYLTTNVGRVMWPDEACPTEGTWKKELERRKGEKQKIKEKEIKAKLKREEAIKQAKARAKAAAIAKAAKA